LLLCGQRQLLEQWLQALPRECLEQHPRLCEAQAALLSQRSQVDASEPSRDLVEACLQGQSEEAAERRREYNGPSAPGVRLQQDTSHAPARSQQRPLHRAQENLSLGTSQEAGGMRHNSCRPPLIEPLSGRELEVLHLLARGQSNGEIAHTLIIS